MSLIDPHLTARVLERVRNPPTTAPELAELTEQELKLLALIAEGLTNRQIGERMFLAEKTVKNYVSSILAKLGLERRTQAAVLASKLLDPEPDRSGSGTRHTNDVPCGSRGVTSSDPPSAAARRRALRSPLSRRSGARCRRRRRAPSSTHLVGRRPRARCRPWSAAACRARLDSASRSTGSSWLRIGEARRCRPGRRCAPAASKPQHRRVLVRQAVQVGAQRRALVAALQLEDRAADVLDGEVERLDGLVDAAAISGDSERATGALQLQAGGEQALDHQVVQVPGDPFAVRDHRELGAVLDGLGAVEGEPGLVGERREQRAVVGGRDRGGRLEEHHQQAAGDQVGAQRDQGRRERRRAGRRPGPRRRPATGRGPEPSSAWSTSAARSGSAAIVCTGMPVSPRSTAAAVAPVRDRARAGHLVQRAARPRSAAAAPR